MTVNYSSEISHLVDSWLNLRVSPVCRVMVVAINAPPTHNICCRDKNDNAHGYRRWSRRVSHAERMVRRKTNTFHTRSEPPKLPVLAMRGRELCPRQG